MCVGGGVGWGGGVIEGKSKDTHCILHGSFYWSVSAQVVAHFSCYNSCTYIDHNECENTSLCKTIKIQYWY